ncbi:unnamed protein product [Somion occarium]|uniref:NAD(P)-binding protein n=1 Tax=Somion occarium TaxID=3059160 RepID=A0ABP1E134_9APHY
MDSSSQETLEYLPRVALVTGAARGIGHAIALRLAQDGIDVAVNDIAQQEELLNGVVSEVQSLGRKALPVIADVSDEDQVKGMIAKTVEALGSLDIMIANAGIVGPSTLLELNVADFDRVLAVNTRGAMLCYKYAGLQMVKQARGGRIIAASSVAGKKGYARLSAYSTSKFAIRGLTQSFATELIPHKITVNCYCPGLIKTAMNAELGGHGAFTKMAMGHPVTSPDAEPDVVASLVSYICKPEAHFITGQSLVISGGTVMD